MFGREYEICRDNYDPTYGHNCTCGTITFATCTRCGSVVDDQAKHESWHASLEAVTDGVGV